MSNTKNDELLLQISELDDQLKKAHTASEYLTVQKETVANIAKKKEKRKRIRSSNYSLRN